MSNQTKKASVFRLTASRVHLTYRGHLPFEDLDECINKAIGKNRKIKTNDINVFRSVVHESSDQENPYDHTHYLVWFDKKLDSRNPRIFDFGEVHPNIQSVATDNHWKNCWQYHEKGPELLSPEPHNDPFSAIESDMPMLKRIKVASNLYEACQAAGVEIRSVNDVNMIRKDKGRREGTTSSYTKESFRDDTGFPEFFRSVVLYGPSGIGKTEFALSRFDNALLVTHIDTLKHFDPEIYDGIVFDDMSFTHIPREAAIQLVDWDFDRDVHCRHANAFIPKKTRKIFTTNIDNGYIFPVDPYGAIARRVQRVEVKEKTWREECTEELEEILDNVVGAFSDQDLTEGLLGEDTDSWMLPTGNEFGGSFCSCGKHAPRGSNGLCKHRLKFQYCGCGHINRDNSPRDMMGRCLHGMQFDHDEYLKYLRDDAERRAINNNPKLTSIWVDGEVEEQL